MVIFKQNNFIDGLNRELDEAKIPRSAYPLLINGRTRRDIVVPANKHVRIDGPTGFYQGLYVAGSYLILFSSGIAYYADISEDPIVFKTLDNWAALDANVDRIYAELVAATTNFFNRESLTADIDPSMATQTVFNDTIAGFPQALFVFDGTNNRPNLVLPSGGTRQLKDYGTWTPDSPEYVPCGKLPVVLRNKLFLSSIDGLKILHSVSGRMSDFVVNIDSEGNKGGDAFTVSTAVSYNELTGLRALASGQLLATTLYASYTIDLDYNNTRFGEPDLIPSPLFPVGCVNNLSTVDVIVNNLQDTAFITQSGIQSFNIISQLNVESNNLPFGAKIHGLLSNPQENTCAVNFDDYSLFAVNTIYGQGVIVYDNVRQNFQSLDLSFRHVKQFAVTKVDGKQRLFFITHTNEVFEAFASTQKETARLYLGEWTPDAATKDSLVRMVDVVFTSVKSSGHVKLTVYSDRQEIESKIFEVSAPGYSDQEPIPFPFTAEKQVPTVSFQLSNALKCWKFGLAIEWNFDGNLTDVSVDGEIEEADNVELHEQTIVAPELFAFVANTGFGPELNPGGVFVNGIVSVPVTKGEKYIFNNVNDGRLVTGNTVITSSIFTANQNFVIVSGTTGAVPSFSLRNAENPAKVIAAIRRDKASYLIGGGNHSAPAGTTVDVELMKTLLNIPYYLAPGDADVTTNKGQAFFTATGKPRYYSKKFRFVEFFFYNPNELIVAGVEPDGYDINSIQFAWLKYAVSTSTAVFKIIVMHESPYTTNETYTPGYSALRLPFAAIGAHAVLSGDGYGMERIIVDGFPYFVCGTGGKALEGFSGENITSYRQSDKYGFLAISSDPVACRMTFKDINLNALDSYTIYP